MVGVLVLLALVAAVYWLSQSGGRDMKSSATLPDDTKADVASHTAPSSTVAPSAAAKRPAEAVAPAKPKMPQPAESGIPGVTGPDLRLTVQPGMAANEDAVGEIRSFPKQKARRAACFSPDGTMVASAGDDRRVWLWNVESAKEIRHFDEPTQSVAAVAFRPTGNGWPPLRGPPRCARGP